MTIDDLLAEAAQMPDAAIFFAQGTETVWTPEHLVPLRDLVRTNHKPQLEALNDALDRRFPQPAAERMGVFQPAGEMAVMELAANTAESNTTGYR